MIKENEKKHEEMVVGLNGKDAEDRKNGQEGFEIQWHKLRYCFEEKRFSSSELETMWENCPWKAFERKVFLWQQDLCRTIMRKDAELVRRIQQKITGSIEGRMLAVRKVYENGLATGFVPSSWNSASYRMRMALGLNSRTYKSMPQKRMIIEDAKSRKNPKTWHFFFSR